MDFLSSDPISSTISDDERALAEMKSEDHSGSMKTSDTSTDGGTNSMEDPPIYQVARVVNQMMKKDTMIMMLQKNHGIQTPPDLSPPMASTATSLSLRNRSTAYGSNAMNSANSGTRRKHALIPESNDIARLSARLSGNRK
jgi:hypothetical protein